MRPIVVAVVGVLAACGGSVVSVGGSDGGSPDSDAGPVPDAAPVVDASTDAIAIDSGPGAPCPQQLATLDAIRQATRKCCPTCNTSQCTIKVDDLCCPISTSNAMAAQLMSDAVAKYRAQCGPVACPATPCMVEPSNECDPNTSLCR